MSLSPQLLEAINGFLLIEFLVILWLFARYIAEGFFTFGFHEGRRQRAAAIGVFTLVLGDFIIRSAVWIWRHGINTGRPPNREIEAMLTAGTTVGVIVTAIGAACVIRYFAPSRWGEWPWIVTSAVALTASLLMAW